jgi:penicillin-binding protein 1A
VIDARNAFLVDSLLQSVVTSGTASRALALKRHDLAGKTGTTNDAHDAWFAGYNPALTAVVWVGHDQPRKLGERETGGGLALPIWMSYMSSALTKAPEQARVQPPGIVALDGEYYLSEMRPGQGVSNLGVNEPATPPPAVSAPASAPSSGSSASSTSVPHYYDRR